MTGLLIALWLSDPLMILTNGDVDDHYNYNDDDTTNLGESLKSFVLCYLILSIILRFAGLLLQSEMLLFIDWL